MIICGSGSQGELTLVDLIGLMSFAVGLENLDLNVTAADIEHQTADLDARVNAKFDKVLSDIHTHLRTQDDKLDTIMEAIKK